jgi:hypothetical protein
MQKRNACSNRWNKIMRWRRRGETTAALKPTRRSRHYCRPNHPRLCCPEGLHSLEACSRNLCHQRSGPDIDFAASDGLLRCRETELTEKRFSRLTIISMQSLLECLTYAPTQQKRRRVDDESWIDTHNTPPQCVYAAARKIELHLRISRICRSNSPLYCCGPRQTFRARTFLRSR